MMRITRRNNVLLLSICSSFMLIYYIYNEIMFHSSKDEFSGRKRTTRKANLAITEGTFEISMIRSRLQQEFQQNGVIASKENSKSTFSTQLACASELFVAECNGAGLAAMLLMTLDHLSTCRHIGGVPTIFWRNCGTVCPSNATVNSWNWFFEPLNPNVEEKAKRVLCFGNYFGPMILSMQPGSKSNVTGITELLNLSFKPRHISGFDGFGLITRKIRFWANSLIKQFVKVNPQIQVIVDKFYNEHLLSHTVLAVHVRGTDHSLETEDGKLPSLTTWIQNAKHIIKSLPTPTKIFIASDNSESIKKFVKKFGKKVVFIKALRATKYDGREVHHSNYDPYKLGAEVLIDILLMARADHFLHAESSVAALVTYFNPEIHTHFLENRVENDANQQQQLRQPGNIYANTDTFFNDGAEDDQDSQEISFQCFQMNSQYSVCPNMRKGIFIDPRKLQKLQHLNQV